MYYNIPIAIDGSVLAARRPPMGLGLGLGVGAWGWGLGPSKTPGAKVAAVAVEAPFSVFALPGTAAGEVAAAVLWH
jgi:hypothetical protein